jgi:hypothetical protein
VHVQSNCEIVYSDTYESSPPIKIVDKATDTPAEAALHGNDTSAVIAAMSYFKDGKKSNKIKLGNAYLILDQMVICSLSKRDM